MAYAVKSAGYTRNAGKRWRGDDVRALRSWLNKGASVRLISLKLGRPDSAIRAKARALGFQLPETPTFVAPPPKRTLTRSKSLPVIQGVPSRQADLFGAS